LERKGKSDIFFLLSCVFYVSYKCIHIISGPPIDSNLWYPGEPNDVGGTEDYVNMFFGGSPGHWQLNDISPSASREYVCEYGKNREDYILP